MSNNSAIVDAVKKVVPDLLFNGIKTVIREKPYGIIKKRARICYDGIKGDLVWDALLFNEITFEDEETHTKRSFGLKWDDEKTEKEFDEIVKKYGIS